MTKYNAYLAEGEVDLSSLEVAEDGTPEDESCKFFYEYHSSVEADNADEAWDAAWSEIFFS